MDAQVINVYIIGSDENIFSDFTNKTDGIEFIFRNSSINNILLDFYNISDIILFEDMPGNFQIIYDFMQSINLFMPICAYGSSIIPQNIVNLIRLGVFDYFSVPLDNLTKERLILSHRKGLYILKRKIIFSQYKDKLSNLTPRELQVAKLLSQGYNPKRIAPFLNISHRTVEIHASNVYKKLSVRGYREFSALSFAFFDCSV